MANGSTPLAKFFALQEETAKSLMGGAAASADQFIGNPSPQTEDPGYSTFGEKVSAGLRAGGHHVESDIRTVGAIID